MTKNATPLFTAFQAAEAAFNADPLNLDKLYAMDAAEAAYRRAIEAALADWRALPDGNAKYSAETNADDTEGTDEDRLLWLQIAIATHYEASCY